MNVSQSNEWFSSIQMFQVRYTRNLFLRGLCIIYLFAFLSFYIQIPGEYSKWAGAQNNYQVVLDLSFSRGQSTGLLLLQIFSFESLEFQTFRPDIKYQVSIAENWISTSNFFGESAFQAFFSKGSFTFAISAESDYEELWPDSIFVEEYDFTNPEVL